MNKNKIEDSIKGISERESYFKKNIENHKSFEPEFKAVKKIIEIIKVSPIDFEKIKKVIETTESSEHYNGSGWHDLKIRVNHLAFLLNESL